MHMGLYIVDVLSEMGNTFAAIVARNLIAVEELAGICLIVRNIQTKLNTMKCTKGLESAFRKNISVVNCITHTYHAILL